MIDTENPDRRPNDEWSDWHREMMARAMQIASDNDKLHALLDVAGIDRANRAEGNASRVYTLSERVQCVLRERDRAVQAEELARHACKNAVERARKLGEQMDEIVGVM